MFYLLRNTTDYAINETRVLCIIIRNKDKSEGAIQKIENNLWCLGFTDLFYIKDVFCLLHNQLCFAINETHPMYTKSYV